MKPKILKFPKNFYWGTATSAYQVEGGIRNDWSSYSNKYDAGIACDHYNRFEEDFDLAKKMNNNAHRFSISWARIEPEEGKFDQKEIEHYRKVILALKKRNLEPFVTLWHWSLPVWLTKKGGLANKKFPQYFEEFVERIMGEYKSLVKFWITLNEPMVLLGHGYIEGTFPPFKKLSIFKFLRAFFNLMRAHKKAYKIIHKINPKVKVSISQMMNYFEPAREWCPVEKIFVCFARFFQGNYFYFLIRNYVDFVGFSYYHYNRVVWHPPFSKNLNKEVSDMGWEIYPKGIYHVIRYLKKYNKPIYITENGLADAKDKKRTKFIIDHLKWVHKAIEEGVDVRGYFHWSLMDNFEWARGFKMRFGLIEIDYKTLKRIPRPSSKIYTEICKNNAIKL